MKYIILPLLLLMSSINANADTGKTYEQVLADAHNVCISLPDFYHECMAGYMIRQGYVYRAVGIKSTATE